jgi:hypothetical protein
MFIRVLTCWFTTDSILEPPDLENSFDLSSGEVHLLVSTGHQGRRQNLPLYGMNYYRFSIPVSNTLTQIFIF